MSSLLTLQKLLNRFVNNAVVLDKGCDSAVFGLILTTWHRTLERGFAWQLFGQFGLEMAFAQVPIKIRFVLGDSMTVFAHYGKRGLHSRCRGFDVFVTRWNIISL